jgi:hypothetical protein
MELDTNKIDHVVFALLVEESRDKTHETGENQERPTISYRANKWGIFRESALLGVADYLRHGLM